MATNIFSLCKNFFYLTATKKMLKLKYIFLFSENDILEHDESYEQFYMSFAALAADSISAQCSTSNFCFSYIFSSTLI